MSDHVKVLREMFAVCANERRMKEADALDAAIAALAARASANDTIEKIVADIRILAGHYHRNAHIVRELVGFADQIEQALSARASAGEGGDTRLDTNAFFWLGRVLSRYGDKLSPSAMAIISDRISAAPQPAQTQELSGSSTRFDLITSQPAAAQGGDDGLPDEGAYLIQYDDRDQSPEMFAGCGAKDAAVHRYAQISGNWNAHLFAKIASNSRDCTTPNAALAAAPQPQTNLVGYEDGSSHGRTTPPAHGDGEAEAFEAWAVSQRYDMQTHPLHWLFLNQETYAARQGWKAGMAYALATRPAPTAEDAGVDRDAVALSVLAALGHKPKEDDRCRARVVHKHPMGRPPGPGNTPIFCYLKAGHEGQHRCNHGGMSPSFPFRETDEVEFGEPIQTCEKCRTAWPCADARAALATETPQAQGMGDG